MSENHEHTTASKTPTAQIKVSVPSEQSVGLTKRKSKWPTTPAKWIRLLEQNAGLPEHKSKWPTTTAERIKLLGTPLTILVTILIAVGGLIWGVYQFKAQESDSANMQATQVAAAQTQTVDQQEETTLQTFISNIQELLLNDKLLQSKSTSNVAIIARVRTLTTLRKLHANRNKIVLHFLKDAHLIGMQNAVINLSNADLSGAFLGGADLSRIDLSNANLSGADLSYANLKYASHLTQQQLDNVYSCSNATLLFTGIKKCNQSRSKVTLTYWYTESPTEPSVIGSLINQFEQLYPNIKIKPVYKPFNQARTEFVTAAQTGNTPDILRADVGWVTQFAWQGYLLNIDSYLSQSHPDDLSYYLTTYLRPSLSYDKYNGHLYGLPQVTDFLALLYNQDEFARAHITSPPKTMTDFETDAIKIVQSKAATYGFETSGESYYVLPFLYAFGGGMFDQHNNIVVNSQGSVNGLNFLLKLQNTDKVMPAQVDLGNGYTNMVNDFKSGKTAMIFDGPYEVANILTGTAFSHKQSNLRIVAVPMGPSGDQPRSPVGGQSYVIPAGTAHPAEAYKFISFMSSTNSQVAISRKNDTLPTLQPAYQYPEVSSNPVISEFHHIQNTAIARPAIPQGAYLFDAFDPNIGAALDGAMSPTDALNAVADAWKQLLAGP